MCVEPVNSKLTDDMSILILSTEVFCNRLKMAMKRTSMKLYAKEFKVKVAESVEDVHFSSQPDTVVDFVVVAVDTTLPSSIEFCRQNLILLEPKFVSSRMCILNGACRSGPLVAAKSLIQMSNQYNIPYINGQVMDNNGCKLASERLMDLAATSTGFKTGTPVIIPTPKDLSLII